MIMSRPWGLAVVAVLCLAHALPVTAKTLKGSRPNIILVLTDDQGMGDLSCMGNPVLRTPQIDRFHAQSTRFTDFHVSPTCAPTRSAIMSGRRPFEVGVTHTVGQRERMALDVTTFPQALQKAGYKTGLFGKWHLGDEKAYLPQNRGFDEVLMHGGGGVGQYTWGDFKANTENCYFDNVLLHNDTIVKTRGFCTDVFFDAALAWIGTRVSGVRSQGQRAPFFAYISLNAPHGPMIAPAKYKKRFLEMGYDEKSAARYGMIENIDDNVGRMMKQLAKWKALENTLVIFMTDNGMSMGSIKIKGQKKKLAPYNARLRGGKNSPWEGGTHVPAFWQWKGVLGKGVDIPALTAHLDLYRTFCELAGADIPESKLPPGGRSLVPLLEDPKARWSDRKLFVHRGRWDDGRWNKRDRESNKYNGAAVRTQRWRLVFDLHKDEVQTQLSDITADPGERTNVAEQYPEVVKQLRAAYDPWWSSTESLLVNEGLPWVNAGDSPLNVRYDKQLKRMGIPEWEPKKKREERR